ncbi:TetR/AcrR family transcriptional regulator [Stigmatella sp. ncwal1]|uniref:TetR/AcrR family transcriptional regulator n=1 Tax=Stigmatella ashevillensis TaxID=2995309 RepID=A0ABT5D8J8_9BACT|nr:TetR/AcrR family transcriptional regulator [Stigmatella ashevillena]MDC0709453.1 TetR/AcrR family transcriptional regulator [Stigmatella ashevillena]
MSREESQERTRAALLDSAREQIATHGVAAASVRGISEAAGFSQGAFYSNFASKEAMLLEVMAEHMRAEAGRFATAVEKVLSIGNRGDGPSAVSALRDYLHTLNTDGNWPMLTIELQLYANRSESFATQFNTSKMVFQSEIAKTLTRLFASLGIRPALDPLKLAVGFIALSNGYAVQGDTASPEGVGEIMFTFLDAIIRSSERTGKEGESIQP